MMTMMFYVNNNSNKSNNNNSNSCSKFNRNAETIITTTKLARARTVTTASAYNISCSCRSPLAFSGCCCQTERTVTSSNSKNESNNVINDIYNSSNKRITISSDLKSKRHNNDCNYSNEAIPLEESIPTMLSNSDTFTIATETTITTATISSSLTSSRPRKRWATDNSVDSSSIASSKEITINCCGFHRKELKELNFYSKILAAPSSSFTPARVATLAETKSFSSLTTLNHKCKNSSLKATTNNSKTNSNSDSNSSGSRRNNHINCNSSSHHYPITQPSLSSNDSQTFRRRTSRGTTLISSVHNIISLFGLQLSCLLLLRLLHLSSGLAVSSGGGGGSIDSINANLTELGSPGMYNDMI